MSEDLRRLKMDLRRMPYPLDTGDTDGVRRHTLRTLEEAFSLTGACPLMLHYVGPGWVELLTPSRSPKDDEMGMMAAAFRQLANRPDVVRAFRQGEVVVPGPGGGRRAIGILEWVRTEAGETTGWWAAWRHAGTNSVGVGVLHGEWQQAQGGAQDDLPDAFDAWLDPGSASVSGMERHERPAGRESEGSVTMGATAVEVELPPGPGPLAEWLGTVLDDELRASLPVYWILMVWRPGVLERWNLNGVLPLPMDEVIRGILAQGEVLGVGVVHPAVAQTPDGSSLRAYAIRAERDGRVGTRVRAVVPVEGTWRLLPPEWTGEVEVGEGGLWIGVPPSAEMTFTARGFEGGPPAADA